MTLRCQENMIHVTRHEYYWSMQGPWGLIHYFCLFVSFHLPHSFCNCCHPAFFAATLFHVFWLYCPSVSFFHALFSFPYIFFCWFKSYPIHFFPYSDCLWCEDACLCSVVPSVLINMSILLSSEQNKCFACSQIPLVVTKIHTLYVIF
jgi:hypothetical protein